MGTRYLGGTVGHYHLHVDGVADNIKRYMASKLSGGVDETNPGVLDSNPAEEENGAQVDNLDEDEGENSDKLDDEMGSSGDEYHEGDEIADPGVDDYLFGGESGEYRI